MVLELSAGESEVSKLRLLCLVRLFLWFCPRSLVSDLLDQFHQKQLQLMLYSLLPKLLEREVSLVNSLNSSDQVANHLLLQTEQLLLTCHQSTVPPWVTSQLMIKLSITLKLLEETPTKLPSLSNT